ncbi:MAG: hypothetical protein HS101_12380 [Planctomycetia bacterium]|nr:hypothetical protein [Planctomycetia bacterium]MCC7315031.1 hypothetical protein [Planctomycetota bacterium]
MAGLPYKRRRLKRGLALLNLASALALTLASAASFQWSLTYFGATHNVMFIAGGLYIPPKLTRVGQGITFERSMTAKLPWKIRLEFFFKLPSWSGTDSLFIPFGWPVVILAAGSMFALWKVPRGFPDGHCQSCGYNLTGNQSGICPECGTTTARRANDG